MALAPAEEPASTPRFAYASTGGFGLPKAAVFSGTDQVAVPAYESAEVVGAPEVDDDHPDALSYVPFETASLMTDSSVADDPGIAPLTHPEQNELAYLFDGMEQPTSFTLRRTSGYRGLAGAQKFTGHAVKSLYAEMAGIGRTRVAQTGR